MLRELGLTARGVGILTMVVEREPMTQRALGASIGVDRSTMVVLLDELEAKGFVRRARHPEDRRAFLIEPTDPGVAAQKRALQLLDKCEERYLAVLSRPEQHQLRRLLARLFGQ